MSSLLIVLRASLIFVKVKLLFCIRFIELILISTMCQDCGGIITTEQLEGRATMCQACKDAALFKQPPPNEDCPICFMRMPSLYTGFKYNSCCGKIICSGCIYAVHKMKGETKCPFCRVPTPTTEEEMLERIKKLVEMDDDEAIRELGCCYYDGKYGLPQDRDKALELWHRAGELGCAAANASIGNAYYRGRGVERDIEKGKHYWELAAMGGNIYSRYNLGVLEEDAGNMSIALKHHIVAAECGDNDSLKKIKEYYVNGHATKDDYAKALRAHHEYICGIKSAQRDEAASYKDRYRYL